MLQGNLHLVPLVGELAQTDIRGPCGRRRRPTGRRSDLQSLLAGLDGRVQAPPGALDLAEFIPARCGHSEQVGRMPPSDAVHQGALGLRQPAAEPPRYGQLPPGDRVQQPLTLADRGQGLGGERSRALGVTAELGEIAAIDRDICGDIHQHAGGPADGGLERLIGRAPGRAFGGVE